MSLDFIAGCLGGVAGVVVGHPLDTVKVNLQTQSASNPIYRSTWHCMSTIAKKNGLRGLYSGITSPMAGVGAVNAIVFGIYGNVQRNFKNPDAIQSHGIAGAIAGLCQSVVCSPMELAKTRLQLQDNQKPGQGTNSHKFTSPTQCMRHILRTEGIRGCFRGLLCTISRDVPAFYSYFVTYESIMRLSDKPTALQSFLAGGFAGMASWGCCYPTDVIKSCIQADGSNGKFKYKGIMDCIMYNYKNHGLSFFFRGFNSTIIRAFPVNAACFSIVALFMRLFKDGGGIDVTMHAPEQPMVVLMCLNSTNLQHTEISFDMQQKRTLLLNSMRAFNMHQEGVCHTEMEDIVDEIYDDHRKFYHTPNIQYADA